VLEVFAGEGSVMLDPELEQWWDLASPDVPRCLSGEQAERSVVPMMGPPPPPVRSSGRTPLVASWSGLGSFTAGRGGVVGHDWPEGDKTRSRWQHLRRRRRLDGGKVPTGATSAGRRAKEAW
jgi:hypothetical protein